MKKCKNCNMDKDLFAFNVSRPSLDGRLDICRSCANNLKRVAKGLKPFTPRLDNRERYLRYKEKIKATSRKKYLENKEQNAIRHRLWRKQNADFKRSASMEYLYGINLDSYNEILINQNCCCAICFASISDLKIPLSVDHDHKSRKIRGLLCNNCNNGLGRFKDSTFLLYNAEKYMRRFE